ncbi:MAG: VWA domain-containing protein [Propioniciclava sp.]|uniref:VWA domain-containing protein n=1 Tax=Propioniciclava sp. TaxID=2038686 RepID=UPI0039E6AE93
MNLAEMFLQPERLWTLLVVPLLIAAYIWAMRRKNRSGMRFTNTAVLGRVVRKQSPWRRHLAVALSLLALIALSLAWARPNGVDRVPRERATIVLVVDVSQSMAATDVQPSRLEAAQELSKGFLRSLPEQYNVAVVSMSGNPATRLGPTTDRGLASRAIDALALQDGTAVGDAIYVALSAIEMAPAASDGSVAPGAIVMLSDGRNTAGRAPAQAAAEAKKQGVPVHTIAYGTENGSVDLDGKRERVKPDRELMASIAQMTGGTTAGAETAGDLERVYSSLRSEIGFEEVKKETTATWAGYGLAFAVLAALAAVSLGARWP